MIIATNDNKNFKIANYRRTYRGSGFGEHQLITYKQLCNITTPNFILYNGNNAMYIGSVGYSSILFINGQGYAYKMNGTMSPYIYMNTTINLLNSYGLTGVELY